MVAKIYIDNKKYKEINNSFDFKLIIFYNIYNRSCLLAKSYIIAFLIILKKLVQEYYYNYILLAKTFNTVYAYI